MEIILNDKTYNLPPRTPKIAKLFDGLNGSNTDVEYHYKSLSIIEGVLGKAALKEIFGTSNKEEISVIDSLIVAKKIDEKYLEPLKEFEWQKEANEMNTPAMEAVAEILANASVLERIK